MAEIFTQILNVVVLGLIAVIVVYAARALDKYTKKIKIFAAVFWFIR